MAVSSGASRLRYSFSTGNPPHGAVFFLSGAGSGLFDVVLLQKVFYALHRALAGDFLSPIDDASGVLSLNHVVEDLRLVILAADDLCHITISPNYCRFRLRSGCHLLTPY